VYSEENYAGGYEDDDSEEATERRFPGLGDRPPLVINAPSFRVHFVSDNSR
jgi:hypothetical protein